MITDGISCAWSDLLSVTSAINFGVLLQMKICLIHCQEPHRPFLFVLAQNYTVIVLSLVDFSVLAASVKMADSLLFSDI